MNCCNDYGQCTQGKDCPVRMSPAPRPRLRAGGPPPAELPEPTAPFTSEEPASHPVDVWLVPLAAVLIILILLLARVMALGV